MRRQRLAINAAGKLAADEKQTHFSPLSLELILETFATPFA